MGLFNPGRVVVTRNVDDRRRMDFDFFVFVEESLERHLKGDWGDLCPEDKEMNDESLEAERNGSWMDSLFSMYRDDDGTELFIITECDRSVTTILFPWEY